MKKWLIRLGAALTVLVAFPAAALAVWLAWDAATQTPVTALTNVQFTAGDGALVRGYLAQPAGPGPHPAVIMIHEWWGLRPEIIAKADKLAAQGYVVLAPDTYRGQTTASVPRALWLRINTPVERVMGDLQAAYDFLAGQAGVDATRIASTGFCYGGEMSLRFGTRNPNLAAVIILYGSMPETVEALGVLPNTGRPVLGIFGAEDQQIPLSEVQAFERLLQQAGVPHQITVYPGVGHAFVQPETIAQGGAARQAWEEMVAFLDTHLK